MNDTPKIALEIVALSPNVAQNHSYALILGEKEGDRRLPVMIGTFEAQAIAVALEKIIPSCPLTHDLIKNMLNALDIRLKEVVIDDMHDKVFYAKLVCEHNNTEIVIDSRTSDAIALAIRFDCPIYTYERILDQTGFSLEANEGPEGKRIKRKESKDNNTANSSSEFKSQSIEELKERLEHFLENEEYEKAAQVRDELNKREATK